MRFEIYIRWPEYDKPPMTELKDAVFKRQYHIGIFRDLDAFTSARIIFPNPMKRFVDKTAIQTSFKPTNPSIFTANLFAFWVVAVYARRLIFLRCAPLPVGSGRQHEIAPRRAEAVNGLDLSHSAGIAATAAVCFVDGRTFVALVRQLKTPC